MATYSGFDINEDQLPPSARARIDRAISKNDFAVRLKDGGEIVLDANTWVIGSPDFNKNTYAFIACDRFVLKNKAKIVTNGNTLVIFANEFHSENGTVLSFDGANVKAMPGADGAGASGHPGDSGGLVSMHVINSFQGFLNVDLSGQHGGDGGSGLAGQSGLAGPKGHDAAQEGLWCKHSGQDGHPGGPGMPGGAGGNGGVGGHGGIFELYNIGPAPLSATVTAFAAKGGSVGKGGEGGPGGVGGPGGAGGNETKIDLGLGNHRTCDGGKTGPAGPNGAKGTDGLSNPATNGAEGQMISKNLDLELILRNLP